MRRLIPVLALAVAALAVLVWHAPILRSIGAWLRVEDSLERADAIVVLAGGTPRREATAAALWREGWAPRIIISRPFERPDLRELIDLGIRRFDLQGEAREALKTYGVPADRIIAIPDISRTTEPELALVRDAARAHDYRRLILVSSPEHTRRVKIIWSRLSPAGPHAIVVPARELFPFEDWWRRRRAAESVLHEYLGHLVLALGISHLFR
jgi:uncharacterized SAM-binding protein YcdF (DUF218 family)